MPVPPKNCWSTWGGCSATRPRAPPAGGALGRGRAGIGAERRRPLRAYSRGMLQRVGIAQALLNDPEVVFLDEPMTGLDPLGRRDVRNTILALREEGRTVFVSSHILSDAEAVCSHVAILSRGRLAAAGRIADLGLDVRGWELVAAGAGESVLAVCGAAARRFTVVAVVLLVLLGAALQVARDHGSVAGPVSPRVWSVLPAGLVRRAALSFEAVLADLYWIRAVQHYGRTRLSGGRAHDYAPLHSLLDAATTLDPRFDAAYRLGAVFLAEPPPGGAGRPDLAVALLRKGAASVPDRWQYLQDIGFVHYWWLQDVEEAARWFRRAADTPGAPWWLRFMAATAMTEGGRPPRSASALAAGARRRRGFLDAR